MLEQRFVDFARRDVFTALDDEFLDAPGDKDEAVGVDVAQVSRVHPAVGFERAARVFRVLVIAFHHIVAAHHELADDARRHVAAGTGVDHLAFIAEGAAGTADPALAARIWIGEAGRVRLRHAERFDDADAEFIFERAMQFRRQGRGG